MTRKEKGDLGEAKAMLYFVENGYSVFLPICHNLPFDFIVYKDQKMQRVSVKSTSSSGNRVSWCVGLRNVSRRNYGAVCVKLFNNQESDVLAVYIIPEDRVVLFESLSIQNTTALHIRKLEK